MTKFRFVVSNPKGAAEAIKKINAKFNLNVQVNKILYREINLERCIGNDAVYSCELVFPFPNIVPIAWISLAITAILALSVFRWWLFLPTGVLFWAAYTIKYMTGPKYYFRMLKKGMIRNGYKGNIRRI